jgi:YesN/AraC family two-component response regulator
MYRVLLAEDEILVRLGLTDLKMPIMGGMELITTEGKLNPANPTTRAEAAQFLMNVLLEITIRD